MTGSLRVFENKHPPVPPLIEKCTFHSSLPMTNGCLGSNLLTAILQILKSSDLTPSVKQISEMS